MPRRFYNDFGSLRDNSLTSLNNFIHELNTKFRDLTYQISRIEGLDNLTPTFFNSPDFQNKVLQNVAKAVAANQAATLSQAQFDPSAAQTITGLWAFNHNPAFSVGNNNLINNLNAQYLNGIPSTGYVQTTTTSFAQILGRQTSIVDVSNTTTETAVYTLSIPGGTLSTNRALYIRMIGDYLNNSGANADWTIRLKYGATTFATVGAGSIPTNTNRYGCWVEGFLSGANATNAQVGMALSHFTHSGTLTADNEYPDTIVPSTHTTMAEDSTVTKNFVITFQHSVANASISGRSLIVQVMVL